MQCNDDFQDAREYNNNDNDNLFDVFDTRHINVQAQIHDDLLFANTNDNVSNTDNNAIYNFSNNYKLYFDEEYHNENNFQRLNVNNYYQRVSTLN